MEKAEMYYAWPRIKKRLCKNHQSLAFGCNRKIEREIERQNAERLT